LSGGTGTSCCGSGVGSGMTVGTTTGGWTTGSTAGGGGGGGITATNAVPPVPPPPPPPGVWYGVKIDSPRSVTSVRPTLIASAMIATCNNRDRIAAQRERLRSSGSDARTRTLPEGTSASVTLPESINSGSVCLDRGEADDLNPGSPDDVDRFDDLCIGPATRRLHEDQLRGPVVVNGVNLRVELVLWERILGIDRIPSIREQLEHDLRTLAAAGRRGFPGGNLHLDHRPAHRVDHHEDDQQHQQNVDHRGHVDVGGYPAATSASGHRHCSVPPAEATGPVDHCDQHHRTGATTHLNRLLDLGVRQSGIGLEVQPLVLRPRVEDRSE